MDVAVNVIMVVYGAAMLFIFLHSISDAHLIYHYLKASQKETGLSSSVIFQPKVTVQLPLYNEMYVAERLLNAVASLSYPQQQLEIQVLDDSTDETSTFIADKIKALRSSGVNIQHIQRNNREGYKAGALKNGLSKASGEFVAIFDADFIPSPDFIQQTIPSFSDSAVGMVQTRWSHVNKNNSLLTNLQAMALDGHFSIEQNGRNAAGFFINFNGTAGVWRKQCIIDAGNWQADTLTEDLDLSYRAQLKGWKFKYLENVTAPAELPPLISALKSQQFRWTKGGAETAKKHLKTLLFSRQPFNVKWHGVFHLVNNLGFVSIITCALLTVPLLFVKEHYPSYSLYFKYVTFTVFSFFVFGLHYSIAYSKNSAGTISNKLPGFLKTFPLFMSLYLGLSLNNAIGVLEGYFGKKSGFIRTPKFNMTGKKQNTFSNQYVQQKLSWLTITEGLFALYFTYGIVQAVYLKNYVSVPFLLMAATGFIMVFVWSMQERKMKKIPVKQTGD